MRSAATGLAFGEVIGVTDSVQETAGFVISSVRPVIRPDDVPLHTHVEGAFTFILSGVQICAARNASGRCGPGSVIYNPPGTTHRDRFQRNEDGRCLSISVPWTITESTYLPDAPLRLENHEALGLARAIARECVCWDESSPVLAE